jgi:hypothetical protein
MSPDRAPMSPPPVTTGTDALLAMVREEVKRLRYERSLPVQSQFIREDVLKCCNLLDSLAAELERAQKIAEAHKGANAMLVREYEAKLTAHVESLEAAEAELEAQRAATQNQYEVSCEAIRRGETLEAELERVKAARQRESDEADVAVKALNATLERVKAERDASVPLVHREQVARREAESRLDKALYALRNMDEPCPDCGGSSILVNGKDCEWCGSTGLVLRPATEIVEIRRAAIAEIEGKA